MRNWLSKDDPLNVQSVEREFGNSLDEWEDRVFSEATLFCLHSFKADGAVDRAEVKDFEEALRLAGAELYVLGRRVLIYAVADSGRYVCLERKKWAHFLQLWYRREKT